ncbi:hypothetical protein [Chlamydia psittaci]|uniref:hypothetical protein n=1 Tax=Chlamydia psittaci TaxID=83554 RepID=UPI00027E4C2F|nr:hypothetical protein [Chlamydia psittaci]AFS27942.1 hypothetical protein B712_0423 [Chlamydia psittaci NJ1]KPZ38138.1 hypothetical protein GWE_00535 [Chlamydia psittaci NJ1]MDS0919969.1 hypothetical protein [Chlamydia psittaci]MDS0990124.1 hypothetical protein [Chlamydia psittaci]MDS0996097.1 hypothetical protein [Chlamydia psittaci]
MTVPTSRGNANPAFTFDDGNSGIFGNSARQGSRTLTTLPPAITTQPSAQGRRQAEAHHQSCMNVLAEARGGTPDHNALVLSHPLQGATGHSSDQQQSVLLLLDLLQDQGSQRYLEGNSSRQGSRTLTKLPPAITTSASNGEVQTAANNQVLLDMLIQSIGGTSGHNSHQLISLLQSLAGSPVSQIHSPQDLVNILHRQDHANMEILISSLIHLAGRNRRGSSSVEKVMQIVEALGGLAGPAGSAAVSLASLISAAVNSERTRRSGRFCYDYCHKCCEKNCGCPGCGCSQGEYGCGVVGRFLCGLFGNFCGIEVDVRRDLEEELQRIENEYSSTILLLALNRLGVDLVALLSGNSTVRLPSLEQIREECSKCSRDLLRILKDKTNTMWCCAAQGYNRIIKNTFLRSVFVSGMGSSCDIDGRQLGQCVRILHEWLGDEDVMVASDFDMEKLALSLPDLSVISRRRSEIGSLGVVTSAYVMQDLGKILMKASHGGRQVWLNVSDLMTIMCMVLAYRGITIVSDDVPVEESRIYDKPEMIALFNDINNRRVINERTQRQLHHEPQENPYLDLARKCFDKRNEQMENIQNLSEESRQEILKRISRRWMLLAGVQQNSVVMQQPIRQQQAPIVTRSTASGLQLARSRLSTTDRDYAQEGARPRSVQNKYGDQLDSRKDQHAQDNSGGGSQ